MMMMSRVVDFIVLSSVVVPARGRYHASERLLNRLAAGPEKGGSSSVSPADSLPLPDAEAVQTEAGAADDR
jgi:hypothetical protein